MFRIFFFFAAFVAGGWLALRSLAVADLVNGCADEIFTLFRSIKEALL